MRDIPAGAFGARNILLTGVSARHHVPSFAGPLSIKAVASGQVEWRVEGVARLVRPDSLLVLPEGAEYSMTMDGPTPSRTLCPVFRRGLVEGALRDLAEADETLLDDPAEPRAAADFRPRWESRGGALGRALEPLAAVVAGAGPPLAGWMFERLAVGVAGALVGFRRERAALAALKPATRAEIHRRLLNSRDAVEGDLALSWSTGTMAQAACMAPFHFNRRFREAFSETPRAWLARRRCERALALLKTTEAPVTEVCASVGYESLGSFSTAFRRRFGVAPSQARRRAVIVPA